jgi:selenocysteine lyase/cysteine desulfurase
MNASLRLLLGLGVARIRQHLSLLHTPVLDWAARCGARVVSPVGERGSGILCVAPDNVGEAFRALRAARVVCSMREEAIRLSPHAYNTLSEMERVAEILDEGY